MPTSDKMISSSFQLLWGLLILSIPSSASLSQVHIVYLGHNHGNQQNLTTEFHIKLLSKVFSSEDEAKEAMLYSYWHSFSGFAASLNSTQATNMAKMEEVISIFRSKTLKLHTTRSWDFMGLPLFNTEAATMQSKYGDDVVIGIFDTGVWPESESFRSDPTLGPIPCTWRGGCVAGEGFNPATACNRKLVGARYYLAGFEREYGPLNATGSEAEFRSPRDRLGHGTHTASTAAGSPNGNASYLGRLAAGTARGGAPRARLAVYKVSIELDTYLHIDLNRLLLKLYRITDSNVLFI